jgi:hypothetical protein
MQKEEFIKKSTNKKDKIIIRRLIKEEEFTLSMGEIERMEKNAQVQINNANALITQMNVKLDECKKLREILKNN